LLRRAEGQPTETWLPPMLDTMLMASRRGRKTALFLYKVT
jgi:hypothetical protein